MDDPALDAELRAIDDHRQIDQRWLLVGKCLGDTPVDGGMGPCGGNLAAPTTELSVQIFETAKASGREKILPDIPIGTLDFSFRFGPVRPTSPKRPAVVAEQNGWCAIIAHAIIDILADHRVFHVAIGTSDGARLHRGEGVGAMAQHGLQILA